MADNFNGSASGELPDDVFGTLNSASAFNLIGTGGAGGLQDRSIDRINNNQVGVSEPGLGLLGDNGGPTLTIALMAGSPAVAGGSKRLAIDNTQTDNSGNPVSRLTTDQRGAAFSRYYNGTVDIGAFESQYAPSRATFTVTTTNDSGPGSLREYVDANNRLGGGNMIAFDLATTNTITLSSGELQIIQDVTITGPGKNQLIVSGDQTNRVFGIYGSTAIYDGSVSAISGLTIANGKSEAFPHGGGIYQQGGALVISDCDFTNNFAEFGGAIFNDLGILTVNHSTFTSNIASMEGGGILSVRRAKTMVVGSTFVANSADSGGGIHAAGAFTISNSTFSENSAVTDGGAIAIPEISSFMIIVSSSAFIDNSAGRNGGGIAFSSTNTRLMVSNSTFARNYASASGGGIYGNVIGGSEQLSRLTNVTIAFNVADVGGGIFNLNAFQLFNSIVAKNAAQSGPDISGEIYSSGFDLIGDVTGGEVVGTLGTLLGSSDNPIDPLLAPLGDFGGPTRSMPLLPGSPAIDGGNNAYSAAIACLVALQTHRGRSTRRAKSWWVRSLIQALK